MTIAEAGQALRSRKVSSVELVEEAQKRIAAHSHLNAFISLAGAAALERARTLDQELAAGNSRGPLHGIPIALKDLFFTKGERTTNGSRVFSGFVPSYDATVAARLQEAGAVSVGKTNLHELAYGITSGNPHFGVVRNPCDPERIPGGSSGGSGAAVATGMALMAMGSDTGGSIRIPAAYCGVVGLKPTFGRVSRHGCHALGLTLDHMGPLTRSVRDAAAVLNVIAGYDANDPSTSSRPVENYMPPAALSIKGMRIGWPENFYFDHVDSEIAGAIESAAAAAEKLGALRVPVRVPDIAALNTIARLILLAEASAVMEPHLGSREDFGPDVRTLLDQGRLLSATDYINAQRARRLKQEEFTALFQKVDCLLTPATPIPAPKIGQAKVSINGHEEDVRLASTRLVRGINAVGLPAISLPCGNTRANLPIGLQIVAPPFEEALLLRLAAAIEDAIGSGSSSLGKSPAPAR
ncbi:MAG: amidase [Bryobacteraceae bacterium]